MDAQRDDVNAEFLIRRIGQVGPGVGDHGDPRHALAHGVRLLQHVVGLLARDGAVAPGHLEHLVGIVDVDMDLRLAVRAGEHEAAAQLRQRLAQLAAIDVVPGQHALGAIAVLDVAGVIDVVQSLEFAGGMRERVRHRAQRARVQEPHDALEHQHETLRAGVDDIGLAHLLQSLPRRLERALRRREPGLEDRHEIVRVDRLLIDDFVREVADYRQDRAFLRRVERGARVLVAGRHRARE